MADILSGFQKVPPKIVGRLREVPLLEWDPGVVDVEVGRCRIAQVVDLIDYVNRLANFPVFLVQLLVKEDKRGRVHGAEEQQREHFLANDVRRFYRDGSSPKLFECMLHASQLFEHSFDPNWSFGNLSKRTGVSYIAGC